MRRGFAFKALLLTFALGALACAAWWAWNRVDPVVEFERDQAEFPPKGLPWKGQAPPPPGMFPPPKPLPEPDMQRTPQSGPRPQRYFRP